MAQALSALRRTAVRVLADVAAWASGVALLTIFAVNISHIVYRTVAAGWVWVADLSALLFLWAVLLGAAAAYGRRQHIVTGFLLDQLTGRRRLAVAALIRAIELAFFFALTVSGATVAAGRAGIDYVQLGVSTSWAYWAIPAGGALMVAMAALLPLSSVTASAAPDTAEAMETRERSAA